MTIKSPAAKLLHFLVLLIWCAAIPLQAAEKVVQAPGLQPVFHFTATPGEPVIEYNPVHHMLAQRAPVPAQSIKSTHQRFQQAVPLAHPGVGRPALHRIQHMAVGLP